VVDVLIDRWWRRTRRKSEPELADWEFPVDLGLAAQLHRSTLDSRAYRPHRRADVPSEALADLEAHIGTLDANRVLVLPWFLRQVDSQHRAYTPIQVLALGASALGLWVDDLLGPHVAGVLSYHEVTAVDHERVEFGCRLAVLSAPTPLMVCYDVTNWLAVTNFVAHLRRTIAGSVFPLPDRVPADLPHKWTQLLSTAAIQIDGPGPITAVFSRGERSRPRAALAALTPHELVIARDPDITTGGHAVSVFATPRERLRSLDAGDRTLRVYCRDSEHLLPLPADLLRAVRERWNDLLPMGPQR
jgi:hypothetical protein